MTQINPINAPDCPPEARSPASVPYIIDGPNQRRLPLKTRLKTSIALTTQMNALNSGIPLKTPTPRKSRKDEAWRHKPRNRPEDNFRGELIKYLKRRGCKVRRVEPSFKGDFDLADLYVTYMPTKWMGWVECKSLTRALSPGQKQFRGDCRACGVKYIVARTIQHVDPIFQ